MKRVFISYTHDDEDIARKLIDRLRATATLEWIDQSDIGTGEHVAAKIKESLKTASAMVVLLSERSLTSKWIQFELGAAISIGLPIVPVFVGKAPREGVPDWLKQFTYVDTKDRHLADVVTELVKAIEGAKFARPPEPRKPQSIHVRTKSKFSGLEGGRVNLVIGICGGTGSGKTTVANRILESVQPDEVVFIQQDLYYRNLKDMPLDYRNAANFDHPDALDNDLLVKHLIKLKAGEPVELPIYDFRSHTRLPGTIPISPKPIVIVEGILIFAEPRLLEQMDIKVFVDTPDDIRFIRRLRRDIAERGRTLDSVIEQYVATVRPMHMQFVEPSKRFSDVIIPEGGYNLVSIDLISGKIRERLARSFDSVGGQT
jgi:uridine kinase